ncbi:hypothetical protein HYH02_009380 [Chlamydomonas schloesseri]|uniref:pantothenate kinase n=1 Tax=Chlamydomonas schloesseri TaxID=2026947 RepID=A0A835TGW5_9CHLO|nr:hypothetical protein HYH02_009380 [Chlamydomonas schloesseri]|eukprot:KAG2443313.1 hypothetical protein HYH02_009380 [Chlamydomonas schloesseri]
MDSELDFTGASIEELRHADDDSRGANPAQARRYQPPQAPSIQLPNQDAEYVNHIAIDIGGSLIKLVYFSPDRDEAARDGNGGGSEGSGSGSGYSPSSSPEPGGNNGLLSQSTRSAAQATQRGGKLHFCKFETSRVEEAINFIEAKGLHRCSGRHGTKEMRVKATGGGAFKYADVFKERLGVVLEKEDEMGCLVSGCNFLLKAIHHEAFTYESGQTTFVPTGEDSDVYPYLLVNIGSGVSMVKVSGYGSFERVSGSSIGGGTFWGLCQLLTQRTNFDEMLELSMCGDNASVDMLVGDIYGGRDYSAIGLSATTIASSFGKVVSQDKQLSEYNPADMCLALCRMVAYNIGQLAHMTATRHGIKRIFFGGYFIRGHPYTMETISYAIRFWSKGEMAAMFLRHEGFLGAVGAFLTVHPMAGVGGAGVAGGRGGGAAGDSSDAQARKVRARFVERFSMGAPLTGGAVVGPAIRDVSEKVSWVEKFVAAASGTVAGGEGAAAGAAGGAGGAGAGSAFARPPGLAAGAAGAVGEAGAAAEGATPPAGTSGPLEMAGSVSGAPGPAALATGASASVAAAAAAAAAVSRTMSLSDQPLTSPHPYGSGGGGGGAGGAGGGGGGGGAGGLRAAPPRMSLHVGVLHFSPTLEPFPLLADIASYEPNTLDINGDEDECRWWLGVLRQQIPVVVEKAAASEGGGELPRRRAAAFGRAFGAHLDKLQAEPGSYGALGLGELFEMREECLREFGFTDVYRLEKQRENAAALAALPDLLRELDAEPLPTRLLSLVEGVLAANIFDWGSQACVALYRDGTILDIYRAARERLGKRPWALDNFDAFAARIMAAVGDGASPPRPPYRRVMMFVDNSGADVVLGMLPFARELLRLGCEVVLVANSLPAINDVTAPELRSLLAAAAESCPLLKAAREAAVKVEMATGGHVPPFPGLRPARRSSPNLLHLQQQQQQLQLQQQQQQAAAATSGRASHERTAPASTSASASSQPADVAAGPGPGSAATNATTATAATATPEPTSPPAPALAAAGQSAALASSSSSGAAGTGTGTRTGTGTGTGTGIGTGVGAVATAGPEPRWHAAAVDPAVNRPLCPKLYVVANGQGSPCLDLRRIPNKLAEACVGVDLLVIEGMGRAIHTNFKARFTCDVLKLAMIKTERLARKLFGGSLYDCVCVFDTGVAPGPGPLSPDPTAA